MKQLWMIIFAIGVAACGGAELTLGEYLDESMATSCAKIMECCSDADREMLSVATLDYSSEETCIASLESTMGSTESLFQASIDAARLEFDGSAARSCIDSLVTMSCPEYAAASFGGSGSSPGGSCDGIFIASASNGETCALPLDCTSGWCDFTDKVCVDSPGLGDACTGICSEGTCAFDAEASTLTCVPLKGEGEPCYSFPECASYTCEGADIGSATAGVCGSGESSLCDGT